ncbi:hypothetical protein QBC47DRAFT_371450 [Echria macrotheca]|uniref:rRNA-processing protein FYV7 n=1 Tax=Echria macrotheca TaxID=438768 RepID=A0AAJ0FFM4_9PEZI|nr:hypothetical protein QBC47DRAFT_371450 [Echria macrotheca]
MSTKRPREDASEPMTDGDGDSRKKAKHGFRVGPDNLPDGPWRRKVTKIKKDLITKAKVKKQYAKVKAEFKQHHSSTPALPIPADELEQASTNPAINAEGNDDNAEKQKESTPPAQIHPERQAMLDSPNANAGSAPEPTADTPDHSANRERRRNKKRKPDYFAKDLEKANRAKAEAEARAAEIARRDEERNRRIAEREMYRRRMANVKKPGRDGKPKIGRESGLLLDRVKRLVEG